MHVETPQVSVYFIGEYMLCVCVCVPVSGRVHTCTYIWHASVYDRPEAPTAVLDNSCASPPTGICHRPTVHLTKVLSAINM